MEKNSIVNYSEFNKVYKPRADHLVSFVKLLDGAVQKSDTYEAVMKQLHCIGWSEELIQTACEAAVLYKEHHKRRIREEQCPTKTISSGDQVFVVCRETRYPGNDILTQAVIAAAPSFDEAMEFMHKTFAELRTEFADATKHWWKQLSNKQDLALPPIVGAETVGNTCRVELLDNGLLGAEYFATLRIESCKVI